LYASPKFSLLDQKEKDFCQRISMTPNDYLNLKSLILLEVAKNKNVTETYIKEKMPEFKNLREKVPLLFEFWVKIHAIPK